MKALFKMSKDLYLLQKGVNSCILLSRKCQKQKMYAKGVSIKNKLQKKKSSNILYNKYKCNVYIMRLQVHSILFIAKTAVLYHTILTEKPYSIFSCVRIFDDDDFHSIII